jgi:hypothetical protein
MWPYQRWMIALAESKENVMTGNAINAKSEALDDLRDLSSDDLDAVSGGFFGSWLAAFKQETRGPSGGQNDPTQMFQQILEQVTER